MLAREGLTTSAVAAHVADLQARLIEGLAGTPLGEARLINPLTGGPHARFLAFRDDRAAAWKTALAAQDVIVDVRDDVLRIGLSIYHDAADIDRFCEIAARL
jgi:selenocysteine lyase/cysteine desulfurase